MPAPIICCLLNASCMALPSVYVIKFQFFTLGMCGLLYWLTFVSWSVCHWPMLAAIMGVSGCRSWSLFLCLFLHFTRAVPSTLALFLQVHVASGMSAWDCWAKMGWIHSGLVFLDCSRRQLATLFVLCWGWGGASNQTSVGFKSMLSAENLARTHACSG